MWPVVAIVGVLGLLALWGKQQQDDASGDVATGDASSLETFSSAAADAVSRATSQIGTAMYQWGGNDPSIGFDCSGLVTWAYGFAKATAADLYAATQRIDLSDLQPGDLLFYNFQGTGIDHVVMYTGNGKVVAAVKEGEPVQSQTMYTDGLVGAGRVP